MWWPHEHDPTFGTRSIVIVVQHIFDTYYSLYKKLKAALERLKLAGVTLNPKKCEFSKSSLKFLRHVIDENGISAEPEKVCAITELPPPTNIPELRRVMGMINQLGKFLPNRAEVTQHYSVPRIPGYGVKLSLMH